MYWIQLAQDPITRCKRDNEPAGSIKGEGFLD